MLDTKQNPKPGYRALLSKPVHAPPEDGGNLAEVTKPT